MVLLKNVSKTYPSATPVKALVDVSLTLPEKGMVFVLGKSGGGKSTLLNVIGCLDKFDSGELIIDGANTKYFSETEFNSFRSRYLGFIFQEFHIISDLTIAQNLLLASDLQGQKKSKARVNEVLARVGLQGYANRKIKTLSGGQKQRIAIARALIKDTKIILADEPTGALDQETGTAIFNILRELSKDKLIIVVSHDSVAADYYADRIIEINNGRVIADRVNAPGTETVVMDLFSCTNAFEQVAKLHLQSKNVLFKFRPKNIAPLPITNNQRFKAARTRLSIGSILKLALSSMQQRLARIIISVVLATLSLTFIGLSTMIAGFDKNKLFADSLIQSQSPFFGIAQYNLEGVGIIKTLKRTVMHTEQYEEAKNATNLTVFDKYFRSVGYRLFTNPRYDYSGIIEYDDHTDLGIPLIAGRYPKEFGEILITSFSLFMYKNNGYTPANANSSQPYLAINSAEDIIGQKLYFGTSPLGTTDIVFTIVGVLDTPFDKYMHVMDNSNDFTTEERALRNEFEIQYDLYYNYFFTTTGMFDRLATGSVEHHYALLMSNGYGQINYTTQPVDIDFSERRGVFFEDYSFYTPLKEDEIIISTAYMFKDFLSYFEGIEQNSNFSKLCEDTNNFEGLLGSTISLTMRNQFKGANIFSNREFKIVGIMGGKQNANFHILGRAYTDMTLIRATNSLLVSAAKNSHADIVNALRQMDKKTYTTELTEYVYGGFFGFSDNIIAVALAFTIGEVTFPTLSVVFILFATLLMYNIIAQSMEHRKKDVGILRALGAKKRDVASIFVIEQLILSLFNCGLALGITYFLSKLLQKILYTQLSASFSTTVLISFNLATIITVIGVSLVSALVALLLPLIRLNKKQPVDLIR